MPDRATITAGVETQAPTAAGALAANSQAMAEVFAALEAAKVERRDMQTSQLNLNPVYEPFREGAEAPPQVVAFQASNMVTVTVRDLASLGGLIDALAGGGGEPALRDRVRGREPAAFGRRRAARGGGRCPRQGRALCRGGGGDARAGGDDPRECRRWAGRSRSGPRPTMAEAAPVAQGTVTLTADVEVVYAIE